MRTFRSILRASALALCAFLAVPVAFAGHPVHYVVTVADSHGEAAARFEASQSYMASTAPLIAAVRSDLRRDSHGFRLADADEFGTMLDRSVTVG